MVDHKGYEIRTTLTWFERVVLWSCLLAGLCVATMVMVGLL